MIPGSAVRPTCVHVALLCEGVEIVRWPLAGDRPDLALVGWLARLQLNARRMGCGIAVCDPTAELIRLLELTGVAVVLGLRQVGGEAEEREERGVEEVVVPDDPVA